MNKAIVFNAFFNGLGVIRALGQNNIPVLVLDGNRRAVGRYSKYTEDFKVVTSPEVNEEKFVEQLLALGKRLVEKAVLFPTNDVWSIAVSKYKHELEKYFLTYNPDYPVIDNIIDKRKFYRITSEIGFRVPKTYDINSYSDIERYRTDFQYPLVLKPISRMNTNRKSSESELYNVNRIIFINSFDELLKYKDLLAKYDFLIQQKIEGLSDNMFTVGIYADRNSNVRGVFCGRKVRGYPIDFGDCIAGESLWVDELVEESKKLVKALKYTGIAEIEYKYDILDHNYYLIEMNPRTWSWIGITPKVGVNLPLLAYKDMIGKEIPQYVEMDKTKRVLWTRSIDDRYYCVKKYYAGAGNKDFPESVEEWEEKLKEYDSVVYADLDPEDPKPGIKWMRHVRLRKLKDFAKSLITKRQGKA